LNEPTAAALAYGMNENRDKERNVLIYDLGGKHQTVC
jgi:molecular chaperone DnaK (HSP70)